MRQLIALILLFSNFVSTSNAADPSEIHYILGGESGIFFRKRVKKTSTPPPTLTEPTTSPKPTCLHTVTALQFSVDGRFVCAHGIDSDEQRAFLIWNREEGSLPVRFPIGHKDEVAYVSPSSMSLPTFMWYGCVREDNGYHLYTYELNPEKMDLIVSDFSAKHGASRYPFRCIEPEDGAFLTCVSTLNKGGHIVTRIGFSDQIHVGSIKLELEDFTDPRNTKLEIILFDYEYYLLVYNVDGRYFCTKITSMHKDDFSQLEYCPRPCKHLVSMGTREEQFIAYLSPNGRLTRMYSVESSQSSLEASRYFCFTHYRAGSNFMDLLIYDIQEHAIVVIYLPDTPHIEAWKLSPDESSLVIVYQDQESSATLISHYSMPAGEAYAPERLPLYHAHLTLNTYRNPLSACTVS